MSPRACQICLSPEMEAIDSDLVRGVSYREVGRRYGFGKDSVARHGARHLSRALTAVVAGTATDPKEHYVGAVAYLSRLASRAEGLLDEAERTGRVALALRAIDSIHSVVKTLGVGTGELATGSARTAIDARSVTVNVQSSPEWTALRSRIVAALDDFPEAKAAVVAAFTEPVVAPLPRQVALMPWADERQQPDLDEDDEL